MRLLDDGHRAAHGHRLRRRPGNRSGAPDLKPGSPTSSPPNRQSTPAHCELAIPVVGELRRTPSRRAEATVERRATARGLVEFIKQPQPPPARAAPTPQRWPRARQPCGEQLKTTDPASRVEGLPFLRSQQLRRSSNVPRISCRAAYKSRSASYHRPRGSVSCMRMLAAGGIRESYVTLLLL